MILDPTPASPAVARAYSDHVLAEKGCSDDVRADARLVVSELVTNAVLHARTTIELNVFVGDDALRIEVSDQGRDRPQIWAHDGTSGRGLPILEALVQSWGVLDLGSGKTVWCEMTLPASSAGPPTHDLSGPRSSVSGSGGGDPSMPRRTAAWSSGAEGP
jgi:hypothetical protein